MDTLLFSESGNVSLFVGMGVGTFVLMSIFVGVVAVIAVKRRTRLVNICFCICLCWSAEKLSCQISNFGLPCGNAEHFIFFNVTDSPHFREQTTSAVSIPPAENVPPQDRWYQPLNIHEYTPINTALGNPAPSVRYTRPHVGPASGSTYQYAGRSVQNFFDSVQISNIYQETSIYPERYQPSSRATGHHSYLELF